MFYIERLFFRYKQRNYGKNRLLLIVIPLKIKNVKKIFFYLQIQISIHKYNNTEIPFDIRNNFAISRICIWDLFINYDNTEVEKKWNLYHKFGTTI